MSYPHLEVCLGVLYPNKPKNIWLWRTHALELNFIKNEKSFVSSNEDLASTSAAVATPLSYFQEDENARAWGDELSGELLYTILLKRVRYSKNTGDGLQWETQKVRKKL